jgi:hypothetical protein
MIESLAVLIAAITGAWGISEWRRESVGRRKVELCEEVLTGAHEFRDIMNWVRTVRRFAGEGETRQRPPETETVEIAHQRDMYFVPIERLNKDSEKISKLISLKYRFMAYFGRDAGRPLETFNEISSKVHSAAQSLINHASDSPGPEASGRLLKKWQSMIWIEQADPDPIQIAIDEAISELEATCGPVLMGSRPMDILDFTLIRPAWQWIVLKTGNEPANAAQEPPDQRP